MLMRCGRLHPNASTQLAGAVVQVSALRGLPLTASNDCSGWHPSPRGRKAFARAFARIRGSLYQHLASATFKKFSVLYHIPVLYWVQILNKVGALNLPEWYDAGKVQQEGSPFAFSMPPQLGEGCSACLSCGAAVA